jgi:hypothetical protein
MCNAASPFTDPESTCDPGVFAISKGSPGEVGFVYLAMTLDYDAVNGADLVRKDDQRVFDDDVPKAHVTQTRCSFPVGDLRHPPGKSIENRGSTAACELFKGRPSGKH